MQLFGPSGSRNFPIDRNPTTVVNGSEGGQAGGASGALGSYTVPVGRRAIIHCSGAFTVRTALAAGQVAQVWVQLTPNGGAATRLITRDAEGAAPVQQTADIQDTEVTLKAGDLIEVRFSVGAGVGAVEFGGGVTGVEFDA